MKRFVYVSAGVLCFVILALVAVSFFMLSFALQPKQRALGDEKSFERLYNTYPDLKVWVDSLNSCGGLKDTFILSDDGAKLHAYYVRASEPTAKTAVLVHGYTDDAVSMFMLGHMYGREMGYNILLPDLRYSGLSEGDHYRMGWLDRLDVLKWMDVANRLYGDSTRMVVHGISMGAATTMMLAGEKQKSYVKCFVDDCGYTTAWDEFVWKLKRDFGLPSFPLLNATSVLCEWRFGWNFKEASALKQVKKCELPMLFIHGDADTYVPTWMVYPLYEACPAPKELWIVPGATHANSYRDNKMEYIYKVRNFTSRYIN